VIEFVGSADADTVCGGVTDGDGIIMITSENEAVPDRVPVGDLELVAVGVWVLEAERVDDGVAEGVFVVEAVWEFEVEGGSVPEPEVDPETVADTVPVTEIVAEIEGVAVLDAVFVEDSEMEGAAEGANPENSKAQPQRDPLSYLWSSIM